MLILDKVWLYTDSNNGITTQKECSLHSLKLNKASTTEIQIVSFKSKNELKSQTFFSCHAEHFAVLVSITV